MAAILKNNLREDDIIARWGGEEFVIYLKNSVDISYNIFEKIRQIIMDSNPNDIPITCSFGIAAIEQEALDLATSNADKALYRAKNSGRNKVIIYNKEMDT